MRHILMNDLSSDVEGFDPFPRKSKSLLGALRAWFGTTARLKRPAVKPAFEL